MAVLCSETGRASCVPVSFSFGVGLGSYLSVVDYFLIFILNICQLGNSVVKRRSSVVYACPLWTVLQACQIEVPVYMQLKCGMPQSVSLIAYVKAVLWYHLRSNGVAQDTQIDQSCAVCGPHIGRRSTSHIVTESRYETLDQ